MAAPGTSTPSGSPQSGEAPRDFPLFLQRVLFLLDVPEHEAGTDVFLPLKEPRPPQTLLASRGRG
jgi:AraC family transcriptional regulator